MLVRRASSAFVCLRCELNIARPRLPGLSHRAPHASFSTSSCRRDAFDEELQKKQIRGRETFDEELKKKQIRARVYALNRVRKSKGQAIRQKSARLDGPKTLGEDSSIIVLELGGGKKEKTPQVEPVRDDGGQISLNLADAIDMKPATLEEIVDQLDKLCFTAANGRPGLDGEKFVTQAVFLNLSKHLLLAFTVPQLSHYYSVKKNVDKDRVAHQVIKGVKQLQSKVKRPAERSEWAPGTTHLNRRLPGLDVHHHVKKRKSVSKHLLVDQILRDVWKLEMFEELEAAGELELALSDWQLALLTAGATETPLDRIGKARIAKIDVVPSEKVLRITADKFTAEYAADDIEQLLQKSESRRLHFKPWVPHLKTVNGIVPSINDVFPESGEVLRTVVTMTGAYLQRTTDSVIIRALDKETVAEAERCLIKLMPLETYATCTVDTTRMDTLIRSENFRSVTFEKESVDYQLRDAKLGRWSLSVSRDKATLPEPDAIAQRVENAQQHVGNMVSTLSVQHHRPRFGQKWPDQAQLKLGASFGHLLYPLENATLGPPHLVPALPGFFSVFNDESFKAQFTTRPALNYEFIAQPGPKNHAANALPYHFPHLAFVFRPTHEGEYKLHKVHLKLGSAYHQVLLPELAVDISIEAVQSLKMKNRDFDRNVNDVKDHILQNLQDGGRLTAPDFDLQIPKWTVTGMDYGDRSEMTKTRYLFTGIRLTQSFWGQYHGNTVSYATRQIGKMGAKDARFRMIYESTKSSRSTIDPQETKEFVADVFKIAGKITEAAATSGPDLKKDQGSAGKEPMSIMTDEEASTDPSPKNEAETSSWPEMDTHVSRDVQVSEEAINDPYILDILMDTPSTNTYNETPTPTHNDEATEDEQKQSLSSVT